MLLGTNFLTKLAETKVLKEPTRPAVSPERDETLTVGGCEAHPWLVGVRRSLLRVLNFPLWCVSRGGE